MSIRQEIQHLPTDIPALRKFGLVVGAVFLLIAGGAYWFDKSWAMIPAYIGAPLVILGAVFPSILKPIYIAWMSLAIVLGSIVTRILLTIFFFLVIVPVGLFFKLIGRDALNRKIDREAKTYWIDKEYLIADRARFEKFF